MKKRFFKADNDTCNKMKRHCSLLFLFSKRSQPEAADSFFVSKENELVPLTWEQTCVLLWPGFSRGRTISRMSLTEFFKEPVDFGQSVFEAKPRPAPVAAAAVLWPPPPPPGEIQTYFGWKYFPARDKIKRMFPNCCGLSWQHGKNN